MKKVITLLLLFFISASIGQELSSKENLKLNNLKVELSVDSLDDLKEFKVKDLKSIFSEVKANADLEFNLVCNNPESYNNRKISYKIKGNSNKPKEFLKLISKLKQKAKIYYKNK